MSFLKKLTKVATDAASAVQDKTKELQKVYKDESWSGILDRAEKNLDNITNATGEYLENLKNVNEKVIDKTAKNANSSWEAIWKSTVAVSVNTVGIVTADLKNQAVRLFNAWEGIEVRKVLSKEKAFLYEASEVLSPTELLIYCGAKQDGAFFAFDTKISQLTIEVYGQIWIDPKTGQNHNGAINLLQYIVLNSTTENLSEEMLMDYCLGIMFKIPEVRNRYDLIYAEYLAKNPDVEALETPFSEPKSVVKNKVEQEPTTVEEIVQTPVTVTTVIAPASPNLLVGLDKKIGINLEEVVNSLNSANITDEQVLPTLEKFKKAQAVLFIEYNNMSKTLQLLSQERNRFYTDNNLAIDLVAENTFTTVGMSEISKAMELYNCMSVAIATLQSRVAVVKEAPAITTQAKVKAPRKVVAKKTTATVAEAVKPAAKTVKSPAKAATKVTRKKVVAEEKNQE